MAGGQGLTTQWSGWPHSVGSVFMRGSILVGRRSPGAFGVVQNGVVAQGANPKALLFFTALLPQFVNPAAPLVPQIALLALTSVVIEFGVLTAYAVLASRACGLTYRPRFAHIINRVGGGLLIGAGAGLATLKRH